MAREQNMKKKGRRDEQAHFHCCDTLQASSMAAVMVSSTEEGWAHFRKKSV